MNHELRFVLWYAAVAAVGICGIAMSATKLQQGRHRRMYLNIAWAAFVLGTLVSCLAYFGS